MRKFRIALLAATTLCIYPLSAFAQDDEAEEGEEEEAEEEEGDDEAVEGEEEEGEEEEEEVDEGELPTEEEGGGLADICKIDPDACPSVDFDKEASRDIKEQLYAVQQVFVLRARRFELQPFWTFSLNDQFVAHNGPGVGLNYWITQVLAVGVNGTFYQPFNSDSEFNFQTRRSARVGVPLTEYQWGAALNFTYVPVAGKFSGFGDFIFQYDAYVVGGVGALSTRPIPTIDPDNRLFDWEPKLAFNAGIGLRIFLNRWFGVDLEVRDYIFQDRLEATSIGASLEEQADKDTWYGERKLTNAVQAQLGVSIFIPFSFDYRLPK